MEVWERVVGYALFMCGVNTGTKANILGERNLSWCCSPRVVEGWIPGGHDETRDQWSRFFWGGGREKRHIEPVLLTMRAPLPGHGVVMGSVALVGFWRRFSELAMMNYGSIPMLDPVGSGILL